MLLPSSNPTLWFTQNTKVLQFMANGILDNWLKSDSPCHLSFAQVLDIALDVGHALDYLHHNCESVIVHRYLKPSNVLLDHDMVAHVSDFGMAKILSDAASKLGFEKATSSVINGTIGYVAPEYGMGGPISPQGDVYSYGILLLEMITGKSPTDDLFNDGSSLHRFCKMALMSSSQLLKEIVDFRLLEQIKDHSDKSMKLRYDDQQNIMETQADEMEAALQNQKPQSLCNIEIKSETDFFTNSSSNNIWSFNQHNQQQQQDLYSKSC